jgi:hypothetical protein
VYDPFNFTEWMSEGNNRHCVLHRNYDLDENTKRRSYWLNPLHSSFFIPSDLPQFPSSKCSRSNDDTINICVSGNNRRHEDLAQAMAELQPESVRVLLHSQRDHIHSSYKEANVTEMVSLVNRSAFIDFQESISRCDLLLPLVEPQTNCVYFASCESRLSGSITQAISYSLPTVLHSELHSTYAEFLTGPSVTYNETRTFVSALDEMLNLLRRTLPTEKRKSCTNPTMVGGKRCLRSQ